MYMQNSVFLLVVFISWHILVARPLAFFAVTGVVRVSHLSVIRQRKKAFCAIANIAYHNRLRAREIGGGEAERRDVVREITLMISVFLSPLENYLITTVI